MGNVVDTVMENVLFVYMIDNYNWCLTVERKASSPLVIPHSQINTGPKILRIIISRPSAI